MTYINYDGMLVLFNHRLSQTQLFHGLERGIEALADILIRWIREFVDKTDDFWVARGLLIQNVFKRYMARKTSGAFYLDAVVIDANMNIRSNTIISVQDRISYDLM